jgi:5'-nucleotidase
VSVDRGTGALRLPLREGRCRGDADPEAAGAQVIVTNDDGVDAPGLHALVEALIDAGLRVVAVAPAENQSGICRAATYREPVEVQDAGEHAGARLVAAKGSPVDCVRVALMSRLATDARLVVSGINHGANLGDDTLISGTVGAGIEAALLGVPAICVSQQSYVGEFHILDGLDHTAPVHDRTARLAAEFALAALAVPAPQRALLNVNVPAEILDASVEVTRLGRRYYERGSVAPLRQDGRAAYRTFGELGGPAPRFESAPGTDFAAVAAGRVSVTGVSYDWNDPSTDGAACTWARAVVEAVETRRGRWARCAPDRD